MPSREEDAENALFLSLYSSMFAARDWEELTTPSPDLTDKTHFPFLKSEEGPDLPRAFLHFLISASWLRLLPGH